MRYHAVTVALVTHHHGDKRPLILSGHVLIDICDIWRLPEEMRKYGIVSRIPLILPHIAAGFLVILFFSRSGIFSSASHAAGLTSGMEDFPAILYSRYAFDIILANVYKETPFVIVMAYAVLLKTDSRLIQTASMLGASSIRIFFKIILREII